MPDKHALLSASSSHRWLHCPPSIRLGEKFENKSSDYAQQGTEAHSLCEYKLKAALGRRVRDPTKKLSFYDKEMESCADSYAEYVLEQVAKAKDVCADPLVLIEQRVDFSHYVKEGFGTADCVIVADKLMHVIDYKHGMGVLVEAEENPQMMCYALGALNLFDDLYDIEEIRMTIFQPRRDNVSTYKISKEDLWLWAENVLTPAATLAYAGEGDFSCGDWCRFCNAKHVCRKRMEYNMQLAQYDFKAPDILADEEIEVVLSKVEELVSWAADVKEYALQLALRGKAWSGWKLVEGRSVRKYTDAEAVAMAVKSAGYNPFEEKILGITAMTAVLGKKNFEEIVGAFIERPQGKPTLVPMADKRPALSTAQEDFSEN